MARGPEGPRWRKSLVTKSDAKPKQDSRNILSFEGKSTKTDTLKNNFKTNCKQHPGRIIFSLANPKSLSLEFLGLASMSHHEPLVS